MKQTSFAPLASLEKVVFRVVALVLSRLLGRDMRAELQRLDAQAKSRSYAEAGVVMGCLLALSLVAASLGVWALSLLFLGVILLFR